MTATKTAERPVTFDHLTKKKPATGRVYVPLDRDSQAAVEKAVEELQLAQAIGDPDRVARVQAKLDQALTDFHKPVNSIRVDFEALGRVRFDALRKSHPPTDEQLAEAKESNADKPSWNPETFMFPLIAATVTSPKMSVEQVRSLVQPVEDGGYGWNEGEISSLFNEAVRVNLASQIGSYSF